MLVVTLGSVALEALKRLNYHDLTLRSDVATINRWDNRLLVPLYHPSPQVLASHRREAEQLRDYQAVAEALRQATTPMSREVQ
jgi:uracil-DNA glycosylase